MCLLASSNGPCEHSDCRQGVLSEGSSLSVMFFGMQQLSQMLLSLVEQNSLIQGYLERLALRSGSLFREPQSFDPSRPDPQPCDFELRLADEVPKQLFRERGFCLRLSICSPDGTPRSLPHLNFKLALYTQETPPRRLTRNITGKKALRGTVEAESTGTGLVVFQNVVINEVSSHYLGDGFYLTVLPASHLAIRPLVLPNFSVKARKPIKRLTKSALQA